jgi:phosphoribosylformimino-5-aminoimidazole carboxamide ribotide isomerase
MSFEVIPAIDVLGGRLARMRAGDPSTVREHEGDPVAVAEGFVGQGARWIHFVDLDAAMTGIGANRVLLSRVAALPVSVQAGGGLTPADAALALEAGADRAVIGASVFADPDSLDRVVAELGERAAVAMDALGGRIVPRGKQSSGPPLDEALQLLAGSGCVRVVYTDVSRDGALRGPDLDGLRRVLDGFGGAVIASGGVRSHEDLDALRGLGIEGAIVGTAIYEAGFDLGSALRSRA